MPFTNAKVPTQQVVRPYVSLKEIPEFIEEGMAHSTDPEACELQLSMGLFLGLRSGEIRFAKVMNIDFDKQTFAPDLTKTRQTRSIYIPGFLIQKVKAFIGDRNLKPNDYLFRRPGKNDPVGPGFLREVVQKAAQKIRKPALTPHRMRTSFATLHAIAGTPIRVIQQMLGHKCIQTTLIYIQDVPELNQIAQARLEALVGFGNFAGAGVHNLKPWHVEVGALLGNLAPEVQGDPILSAAPLLEMMNSLHGEIKRVETALASIREKATE